MLKKVTPLAAAAPFAPGVIEHHPRRWGRGLCALVLVRWVLLALVLALSLLPWLVFLLLKGGA